jgi:hypothetical protein
MDAGDTIVCFPRHGVTSLYATLATAVGCHVARGGDGGSSLSLDWTCSACWSPPAADQGDQCDLRHCSSKGVYNIEGIEQEHCNRTDFITVECWTSGRNLQCWTQLGNGYYCSLLGAKRDRPPCTPVKESHYHILALPYVASTAKASCLDHAGPPGLR